MVQLLDRDIQTREVSAWGGVHVLHYAGSTCSQKLRIFLNLKGIGWQSHPIDLSKRENYSPWFLGINPRGLVPVLVHDGKVHIESNDIITYLEAAFPAPRLIPKGCDDEVAKLLHHEDDLHLDLRTLSFRFIFNRKGPPRSAELLKAYEQIGTGTVQGVEDPEKAAQIEFWRRAAAEGFTDQVVKDAIRNFQIEFEALDKILRSNAYLFGNALSVLDIAWFIYVNRLSLCGYPLQRWHPILSAWFERLAQCPEFKKEIAVAPQLLGNIAAVRAYDLQAGRTLELIAGLIAGR
jgi:ganglioside-induced differentiation-associated protein 1